jgi:hypothetical protein
MPIGISAAAAAALLGMGTQALGNAGSLIPSKTERANKEQLRALEAARKNGTLGLTEQEKQAMRAQRAAPLAAEAARANQELQRMSANSGLTGQNLQTQAAISTRTAAIKDAVESDIQVQDAARAQQQEQEYWARLAAADAARQARVQAVGDVALAGVNAYKGEDAAKKLRDGTVGDRDAAMKLGINPKDYARIASQLSPSTLAELEEYL